MVTSYNEDLKWQRQAVVLLIRRITTILFAEPTFAFSVTSGSNSPVENVVKKLGILGSSPYQLPQGGLLGALPGLAQQQQQMNGISSALNAGL